MLEFWCTYYTQIVFNTAICPYCLVELTPVMPSLAARQPIDAGVSASSLIPSSSWGPAPIHNEQMDHMSNNGDMCSPVVSEPRAILCRTPVINSIRPGLSNTSLT